MVATLALVGCGGESAFLCREDANCGDDGFCEEDGNCSFEDAACPSGRRYGSAGDALHANTCVPVDGTTSASTTESPIVTTTSTTTLGTTSSTTTTSTSGPATSTTGPVTSSVTTNDDGTTTSGETTSGETSSSTGELQEFFDPFDRPNSDDIGNGWWEKTPESFSLVNGRVQRTGPPTEYPNNIVARPEPTPGVNVVVDLEFHVLSTDPELGNPQIHARLQEGDLMEEGQLSGYIAYVDDAGRICVLGVREGMTGVDQCFTPDGPFNEGESYGLVLTVEGVGPVTLALSAFHFDPTRAEWVEYGSGSVTDGSASAITKAGRVGFSGSFEIGAYEYDNFYATWWD